MKRKFIVIAFLFFVIALIPVLIVGIGTNNKENKTLFDNSSSSDIFRIKDNVSGEITSLNDKDFILAVVASEMPVTFETEALKAQIVASYTYYTVQRNANSLSSANLGYDVICEKDKTYKSYDTLKSEWANNFDTYYNKLKECIENVYKQTIKYNGEPIISVYFAISSGFTENSKDVFGEGKSYLSSVASPGDILAPGYNSNLTLSSSELKDKLSELNPNLQLNEDCSQWIGEVSHNESGSVKNICIGNETFTGTQIRSCLELRSTSFEITQQDSNFIFSVRGYGHGVGMSQYGAQYMALQGSTYSEILAHYYTNTYIEQNS